MIQPRGIGKKTGPGVGNKKEWGGAGGGIKRIWQKSSINEVR